MQPVEHFPLGLIGGQIADQRGFDGIYPEPFKRGLVSFHGWSRLSLALTVNSNQIDNQYKSGNQRRFTVVNCCYDQCIRQRSEIVWRYVGR
jgi:hypothetical protein